MTDITLIYVFHSRALKSVIYLQNEPKNALVLLLIHYGSIKDINVFLQYTVLCLRPVECGSHFKFSDEINFIIVLDITQNNLCNLYLKGFLSTIMIRNSKLLLVCQIYILDFLIPSFHVRVLAVAKSE
jgi:hypothetical protein